MASLTRWTRVWVNSGHWWWTERTGVLRFMGSQRVRHNWVTEMNWTELKWTGMDEFNSDDHYIYYGQESLRRNGVAIIVNKRVWNAVLGCSLKNDRMICLFQDKPFSITVIQVYAPTSNRRSWSWMVLWRPTRPSRTNTQKRCPFHYRGLECKSQKSRNTWSNRQIWPSSMKWSRAKANRVLPRECTGHSIHPLPTTQEMTLHMDITRWSTPKSDWLYFL